MKLFRGCFLAAGVLALGVLASPAYARVPKRRCQLDLPHYRPQAVPFPSQAPYLTSDGAIRIVGYNDMQGWLERIDALFADAHPGFRFALALKGTRTAPPALAAGESALAPMGAEFSPEALEAYRRAMGSDPLPIKVAHDSPNPKALSSPIGIFVNTRNPLAKLSLQGARQVFSWGVVRRWRDLGLSGGWADQEIHPVGLGETTAIGMWMRRRAFGGQEFAPGFVGLRQSREVVAAVARDPLAIGFADLSLATPEVKALALSERRDGPLSRGSPADIRAGRYPLDRHLLIYLRRSPGGGIEPWVRDYLRLILSCQGQEALEQDGLGYIPLNPREAASERAKLVRVRGPAGQSHR